MRPIWLCMSLSVAACGPVVAPSVSLARITPEILYAGDVAACETVGWYSADGLSDESTFAWSVNGTPVGVGELLEFPIRGGDTVTCTITPFDGEVGGSSVTTTRIVQNTEPTVDGVQITPQVPTAGGPLYCTAWGFDDPDDDQDLTQVGWTRDGVAFGGYSTAGGMTVPFPGPIESGHTYGCVATPFDGEAQGDAVYTVVFVP